MSYQKITENYTGHANVPYVFEYSDCDDFSCLPYDECRQVYAVGFYGDEIVVVHNGKKNTWGLVGGTIEKGESFEETLVREVEEESNMKVLEWKPVGYQKVIDPNGEHFYQLRVFAILEKIGEFTEDPAGTITEIKLINPLDHKNYFDWRKIGERIIERGIEFKKS